MNNAIKQDISTKEEIYKALNDNLYWTGENGKDENNKDIRKNIFLIKNGADQKLKDIIYNCHAGSLPSDFIYETIARYVSDVCNCDNIDDSIEQDIYETIEADIYTSDLTAWLNSKNDNVFYITEALENSELKDGFQLLAYAQILAKEEIINVLRDEIDKIAQ